MKKSRSAILMLAVLSTVALVGCNTMEMVAGDLLGNAISPAPSGSSGGDSKDAPEDSPFATGGSGLMILPPAAAFQIVYAQTLFLTSYGSSGVGYDPGDGVRWQLTWADQEGNQDTMESARALLSNGPEGSWWYLSMTHEDYTIEYEYLLTASGTVTRLKYRDSETPATRDASVAVEIGAWEEEAGFSSMAEAAKTGESEGFTIEQSRETVTVPAGTFDADRIDATGVDESTGEPMTLTWWIVPEIPGEAIRFFYDNEEGETYTGELLETRSDYRAKL